jgi:transposase
MTAVFSLVYARVAGLDVHKDQVTACIRLALEQGSTKVFARNFSTLPSGLRELRQWLLTYSVTHVAMEGTGVYWMCVWHTLQASCLDLTLCNAHHVRQVKGRKTDQSDAAWIAQLLAAGLLRKSFVPSEGQRQLRELTRARVHLLEERTRCVNTMHRLLQRVGLKLDTVVSDLQGQTALAILLDLSQGISDPVVLSEHARGRLLAKKELLREVLSVPLGETEQKLLQMYLEQHALFNEQMEQVEEQIRQKSGGFEAQIEALLSIGGMERITATSIVAELGDGSAFESSAHISAWAGLSPGNNESAGKKKRAPIRSGNVYVKRLLVQVAMILFRSKGHDLGQWMKKKMVLGFKKAAVATAHKLLVRIWAMWTQQQPYQPPAPVPLTEQQRTRRIQRKVEELAALGYKATLEPLQCAS